MQIEADSFEDAKPGESWIGQGLELRDRDIIFMDTPRKTKGTRSQAK